MVISALAYVTCWLIFFDDTETVGVLPPPPPFVVVVVVVVSVVAVLLAKPATHL
jgi:hypothetical protein